MLLLVSFIVIGLSAVASRCRGRDEVERDALGGFARIGGGLAKVILLAEPLGRMSWMASAAAPLAQTFSTAWIGAIASTLQLYFVISGMADLLHGIDRLLGRRTQEIVISPLRADSFTSAWRRWNLALPAKGGHSVHAMLSLLMIAAITGLAFGLPASALAWAAIHLSFLGVERWRGRSVFAPLPLPLRVGMTLFVVTASMPLLRAPSTPAAFDQIRHLFVASKATLYSVMLDARLGTAYFSTILVAASLLVLAAPRLAWLLELRTRVWHGACIAAGILALAMICVEIHPPPAHSVRAGIRHGLQWPLTRLFEEGNRFVHMGRDGWLYPQHELDRLTMAKDKPGIAEELLRIWPTLRVQGIPLLVIPMPAKAALLPEPIVPADFAGPVHAIGYRAAVEQLRAAGIDVIDPSDSLWSLKKRQPPYFKGDSHWTPEAMKQVATLTAKHIRKQWPRLATDETPPIRATVLDRADLGDLARALDPWSPASVAGVETTQLVAIRGLEPRADAPILLLGGSLIGIYEDPALSFGNDRGEAQHAGFATHLATLIGRPLDVRNTGSAALADLCGPGGGQRESLAGKRLVVVLVPANDL